MTVKKRNAIDYSLILEGVKHDDRITIPAGWRIDNIAFRKLGATAGNLRLGSTRTDGAITPAVAEIRTLEITGAPVSDGDVTISFGDVDYVLGVVDTQSATDVADEISLIAFEDWNVSADGAVVTFEAYEAGAITGKDLTFDGGTTGTTASIAVTEAGVDWSQAPAEIDEDIAADVAMGTVDLASQDLAVLKPHFYESGTIFIGVSEVGATGNLAIHLSPID